MPKKKGKKGKAAEPEITNDFDDVAEYEEEPAPSPTKVTKANKSHKPMKYTPAEVNDLRLAFRATDLDDSGLISVEELAIVLHVLGSGISDKKLRDLINKVKSRSGGVMAASLDRSESTTLDNPLFGGGMMMSSVDDIDSKEGHCNFNEFFLLMTNVTMVQYLPNGDWREGAFRIRTLKHVFVTANTDKDDGQLTELQWQGSVNSLTHQHLAEPEVKEMWALLSPKGEDLNFHDFLLGMENVNGHAHLAQKVGFEAPNALMSMILNGPVLTSESIQIIESMELLERLGMSMVTKLQPVRSMKKTQSMIKKADSLSIHCLGKDTKSRLGKLHLLNVVQAFVIGFISAATTAAWENVLTYQLNTDGTSNPDHCIEEYSLNILQPNRGGCLGPCGFNPDWDAKGFSCSDKVPAGQVEKDGDEKYLPTGLKPVEKPLKDFELKGFDTLLECQEFAETVDNNEQRGCDYYARELSLKPKWNNSEGMTMHAYDTPFKENLGGMHGKLPWYPDIQWNAHPMWPNCHWKKALAGGGTWWEEGILEPPNSDATKFDPPISPLAAKYCNTDAKWDDKDEDDPCIVHYLQPGECENAPLDIMLTFWGLNLTVLAVMVSWEIGSLYWYGIKNSVRVSMAMDYSMHPLNKHRAFVGLSLVRAALELGNSNDVLFGIDPLKEQASGGGYLMIVIAGLLYKAKIALTGFLIKVAIKRFASRGGAKFGLAWAAVPATCIWNAMVAHVIMREAKLRALGVAAAVELFDEMAEAINDDITKIPHDLKLATVRAIGANIVKTQNLYPAKQILLEHAMLQMDLAKEYENAESGIVDDVDGFLDMFAALDVKAQHFVLQILMLCIILDGKIKSKEMALFHEAVERSEDAEPNHDRLKLLVYNYRNMIAVKASMFEDVLHGEDITLSISYRCNVCCYTIISLFSC